MSGAVPVRPMWPDGRTRASDTDRTSLRLGARDAPARRVTIALPRERPLPASFIPYRRVAPEKRSLEKVPFVELFGGRAQGVVSSGSDEERVYVSWYEGKSGDFYCSTNNNRPCGGLGGGGCKHITAMLDAAVAQYGVERVARYLGAPGAANTRAILAAASGTQKKEPSGVVFARFLDYLRYMALPAPAGDVPELAWFVTG
jgi:hypothetical protein